MSVDISVNQPVVLDNGSGVIKAGFAGREKPEAVFGNYIGTVKHRKVMAASLEGDTFIGAKANEHRGLMKLRYPIEHGVVEDWDAMERIWAHVYLKELKISPDERPVLLTEAPLNPRANREKAAEVFFETFNVPALYICNQAILSLYAAGLTLGCVLDVGDGVAQCVPVYEGFALQHAVTRLDVAGRDVTDYLQTLLRKAGYVFTTSSEREIVRDIKERLCYVSVDQHRDHFRLSHASEMRSYQLPDGKLVKLSKECFRAPEILFSPELIGDEGQGVHFCVKNSIQRSDLELRPHLFENILLAGGSTLFENFPKRMIDELKRLAPSAPRIKVLGPPNRIGTTWLGGSVMASLDAFKKIWVSRRDWEEERENALAKLF